MRRDVRGRMAIAAIAAIAAVAVFAPVRTASADPPPLTLALGVAEHPVNEVYRRFVAAHDGLDAGALAALYTEHCLYLAPGAEVVRGRAAVEEIFRHSFASARARGAAPTIRFEVLDRLVADGLVTDVGIFRLGPGEGSRGKFAAVLRRDDDFAWRFDIDSYSGIDPPPPLAPVAAAPAAADPAAAREALLAAERDFAAAFGRRDRDAFFAAVAPDAVFLAPEGALAGKAAIEEAWGRLLEPAEPPFSWSPTRGEVNLDGTMGVTTGPVLGPDGTWLGSFMSTWRREPDGRWRVLFDGAPSCRPPAASPAGE